MCTNYLSISWWIFTSNCFFLKFSFAGREIQPGNRYTDGLQNKGVALYADQGCVWGGGRSSTSDKQIRWRRVFYCKWWKGRWTLITIIFLWKDLSEIWMASGHNKIGWIVKCRIVHFYRLSNCLLHRFDSPKDTFIIRKKKENFLLLFISLHFSFVFFGLKLLKWVEICMALIDSFLLFSFCFGFCKLHENFLLNWVGL